MKDLIERCCICKSVLIDGTIFRKGHYDILNELEVTESVLSRDCALNHYGKKFVEKMESLDKNAFKFDYCSY
jgi:hypothetical protein